MKHFLSQVLPDLPVIQEKRTHMHLENLSHEFIHILNIDKIPALLGLLKELKGSTIVFCNTVKCAHFIEYKLKE
jgi:superfamily II DNA/RNA helicase